jgi:hypothetical protein
MPSAPYGTTIPALLLRGADEHAATQLLGLPQWTKRAVNRAATPVRSLRWDLWRSGRPTPAIGCDRGVAKAIVARRHKRKAKRSSDAAAADASLVGEGTSGAKLQEAAGWVGAAKFSSLSRFTSDA